MKVVRFFLPRISYILLGAIFLGIAASGPKILNFDGDLPRHILFGNLVLQTKQVPTTDLFSYRTIGKPSTPHEWLSEVFFALAYNWLGLSGVVLLTALMIALAFAIVYWDANQRSTSLLAALGFAFLGVITAAIHFLPRPHIFTFVLLAFWTFILEKMRKGQIRAWWILPILMLLWVNLHGMFVLGIAVWLVYLVGALMDRPASTWKESTEIKTILAGGLVSLPITLLSPSGIGIWGTVFELAGDSYITSMIPEYQSANFHEPGTWPFILILMLAILILSRAKERPFWTHTLLLAAFAGLALYSSRMIPIFAILAAPIEAEYFAHWIRSGNWSAKLVAFEDRISVVDRTANGFIWLVALATAVTLLFATGQKIDPQQKGNQFDPQFFPVNATEWLKSHPQSGHMFNDFNWGSYLLFELWPSQQIFIDGHTHIYGDALTREYEDVIALNKNWDEILNKYQVQWAILPTDALLVQALKNQGWQTLYQDSTAIILRQSNASQ